MNVKLKLCVGLRCAAVVSNAASQQEVSSQLYCSSKYRVQAASEQNMIKDQGA